LQDKRQTIWGLMKNLFGPWWRWKIAGAATLASLVLVLFAVLTGMIILTVSAGAIMLIGAGKIRQWLRRRDAASSL
jgi:hypothetical protein